MQTMQTYLGEYNLYVKCSYDYTINDIKINFINLDIYGRKFKSKWLNKKT